jgi:hypothetical protein
VMAHALEELRGVRVVAHVGPSVPGHLLEGCRL